MTEPHGPLQGVKVVACSTAQAGTVPYMLMADLGAEVIKIEVPQVGDNSRGSTIMPGFPSTYFETNNRGVKSVTLNLKTEEAREILAAESQDEREDEIGDLLFVIANLARHLKVDPEAALRRSNAKFTRRFRHIEVELAAKGIKPGDASLEEMEALWQDAKAKEKTS